MDPKNLRQGMKKMRRDSMAGYDAGPKGGGGFVKGGVPKGQKEERIPGIKNRH